MNNNLNREHMLARVPLQRNRTANANGHRVLTSQVRVYRDVVQVSPLYGVRNTAFNVDSVNFQTKKDYSYVSQSTNK